ncbi:FtsK/SpoIIIE domain-containing protein [Staphylococcus pseudoxylosus]|uniref:FtsK/SpoIIIE domain-containing protein n=1 Tax=Staphylococcus pseudoxylosus TaxID=2282419 RepID=UPI002DB85E3F|nr:FtsK/SpoIIIE domain-containing protein [Staphylococcus pseudoxylosus]MEB6038178.1 hypothetical protein [Staphylococcus pseudoxylosus]
MNIDFSEVLNKFEPKGVSDLLIGVDGNGELHSHHFLHENNLLIVGQTGSGKSVAMHQMVLSGMFNKSPRDIQFVFYDPKRVDYLEYKNSPFLMKDIMYHTEELEEYLIELTAILDKRMKQFVNTKTIDIERYNKYARENDLEEFPYIITVIDEIAVPSCESPEIQEHLVRIMQKSRAVGIHFIIGTQTPRRDVITGALKANMLSRIAMKVSGETESMIAIDELGAEQLNGRGDMIYKVDGRSELLQSSYVSEENIETLCDYFNTKYSI